MVKGGKSIETKVSGDTLRFFCVENADNIVGCDWYDTKYCLKSCKFYNDQKTLMAKAIEKVKYWIRG